MAPTNVLAAWRAYEKYKAIASGAKKPPVKKPGSKEEIARLQQETDDQRAELKKVKAVLVIMKSSASTMAAKVWEANPGFERHVREGMAGFHNRPSRHVVDQGCEKDSGGRRRRRQGGQGQTQDR